MTLKTKFNSLYIDIKQEWLAFVGAFFVVTFISYGFLYYIDFIPEPIETTDDSGVVSDNTDSSSVASKTSEEVAEEESTNMVATFDTLPSSITFDSLDKTVNVLNPKSKKVADLDEALLSGAVRHPDSAELGEEGNVFILAHSSYLPNVFNKNFQAFNGIQNLTWGDTIRLRTTDAEYVYQVDRVYKAKTSEVNVPLGGNEKKLTLATCNSFGSKDDRFIVEATLVDQKSL